MQKFIFLLFCIILLTSCKLVYLTPYELVHSLSIKERQDETIGEAEEFLSKHHLRFDYLFLFNDSLVDRMNDSLYRLAEDGRASALQVRVYSPTGSLVSGYSMCTGDFRKRGFLETSFPPDSNLSVRLNYNLLLWNEFDLWEMSPVQRKTIEGEISKSDLVIVTYWSAWINGLSKSVLKQVQQYENKYGSERILTIVVNDALNPTSK